MDRISNLPLSIIETILCLLPYHDVVRTSTLSKEWRYHWTKIPKIMVIAACPEHLMPSKEWEDVFLADFSKLRLALAEHVIQENHDSYQTDDGTLQTIMDMEPVARVTMLRKHISSLETLSSLGITDCAWLFALCAAIDTPLDADTSALLRYLLRKCAALRAEKMCLDDEVIMLHILATISGKYFGQLQSS
ncbi:GEM-associated protein 2 [Tanacetum coccineum]